MSTTPTTPDAALTLDRSHALTRALLTAAAQGRPRAWEEGFEALVALLTPRTPQAPGAALRDAPLATATLLALADEPPHDAHARRLEITASTAASGMADPHVGRLAACFGLDAIEVALLMVVRAAQLDPTLLGTGALGVRPSLVATLLLGDHSPLEALLRVRLHPQAPLRRFALLDPAPAAEALEAPLRLSGGVLLAMEGVWTRSPELSGVSRLIEPDPSTRAMAGLEADGLERLIALVEAQTPQRRLALDADSPGAARAYLTAAAACVDRPVLEAELEALAALPGGLPRAIPALLRDARLLGALAAILMPARDPLADGASGATEARGLARGLATALGELPDPVALCGPDPGLPLEGALRVTLPAPGPEARLAVWRAWLGTTSPIDPEALRALAAAHPMRREDIIEAAVELTRALDAQLIAAPEALPWLQRRARRRAQAHMGSLATRVEVGQLTLDDLALGADARESLEEIIAFARHRQTVLEGWGLGQGMPWGRALTALLHGPPGTGKTLAASAVACALGLDLYRVDLSQLTSKYIGETEKNLAALFERARQNGAALLFDEADALLGRRTEVKNSNDRHANLGVNFLLQALEAFDGVVLMTTNHPDAIDEAFKRRIRFHVSLPAPDRDTRLALWRRALPASAPVADDVELEALAEDFELTGAWIKEAALRACVMAAARQRPVTLDHLYDACLRIYRSLGHLPPARG